MSGESSHRHPHKDEREGRPDPEALLKRYNLVDSASSDSLAQAESPSGQHRHKRGRLRVYLAAMAGAGKTYAMLNEGRRRKERGSDVVVGYIETHGRVHTQEQIDDLEIIPRKKEEYRGVILEEMDTAAIIARHPQVVLVDELAHTNIPGSKHSKRYQDVQYFLNVGIHVVTTLNVQHLESLNDLVEDITGVRVRETLPDRILDEADEIELVDIDPYALRQRMKHGNIYPQERIDTALKNFFQEGNLTALREMALRLTADKTQSQLQRYMDGQGMKRLGAATERVLVGFDHRPHAQQVLRDAWRLAHGLHADFLAVSVQPEGYLAFIHTLTNVLKYGAMTRQHKEEAMRRLEEHALFAEDLGAEVIRMHSHDIAGALVTLAQERHVTQIVLGQPTRKLWEELLRGSIVNRLLRLRSNIDIHIVSVDR